MTTRDELKYLLECYLNNHLTVKEKARFLFLLRQDANRTFAADLIESILNQRPDPDRLPPEIDKQQIFETILEQAQVREASVSRQWRGWMPYAAAVVILICAGALFWINKQSVPGAANRPQMTALTPADDDSKVFLTLADGSRHALDKGQNKVLQTEKGLIIEQSPDGGIAYRNEKIPGNPDTTRYNTVTTLRGGQYHITLPDGTRVWLNAVSSLKFPVSFSETTRTVTLSGEGYFEVAKDTSRPFIVKVNDMQVNVLGTHFNIMAYKEENTVETTLIEGSVQLSSEGERAILNPGQQGSLSQQGKFSISRPDLRTVMAWKNGEFRFVDENVETIMRQIARWYDLSVDYKGDLSGIRLSGALSKKEDVSHLLEILETTGRVRFNTNGDSVIVLPD